MIRSLLLVSLMLSSASLQVQAQAKAKAKTKASGSQRAVTLARLDGRSIAPVCPTHEQIRVLQETKKGRWTDHSRGCGYVTPGNFEHAEIVADSGTYVLVRFNRSPASESISWIYQGGATRMLWTPKRNLVTAGKPK